MPYAPKCTNISSCVPVDMSGFTYVGDPSIANTPIVAPVRLSAFPHIFTFPPLLPQPKQTVACPLLYIPSLPGGWFVSCDLTHIELRLSHKRRNGIRGSKARKCRCTGSGCSLHPPARAPARTIPCAPVREHPLTRKRLQVDR
jgi:hypothetical protein